MALTDLKIRSLRPREKEYKVSDSGGLYITVKANGSRLWHWRYRFERREKRLSFGKYPDVSLAQARALRDEARSRLAAGLDPGEVKKQQKESAKRDAQSTFAWLADAYLEKSRLEGKAQVTLDKSKWLLDKAKADFGDFAINEITAQRILQCLKKVEARGNYETARRLRSKIGAVFRYAVAMGVASTDPTYALKDALVRPQSLPRAAITSAKEFGGLLRAIDGYSGQLTTRIALQLMALLAQRTKELRLAQWGEFDLEARIWSIPAETMKMRQPHKVPLARQSLELIEQLRPITGHSNYLFPSLRSIERPMSENTLNGALRRLGYSGNEATAHGFRASFATLANESGLWHPDAIERALAHVDKNTVRRVYARGEHWDERVRLADWWADTVDELRAA